MKTAGLIGPALDWAVAKCEGYSGEQALDILYCDSKALSYSTNWAQGGPIIEREHISIVDCDGYDFWRADKMNAQAQVVTTYGPTPLIAAMRCYVASKLGDDVEIPEELE